MQTTEAELLERYRAMFNDELIELRKNGKLSEMESSALDTVLKSRGIAPGQTVEPADATTSDSGRHRTVAGVHTFLAWFYAVIGAISLVVLAYMAIMERSFVAIWWCLLVGSLAGLHFLVAWGARRKREWARVTSVVIALLMLFGFPIGTVIGFILIVNAVRSWGPDDEAFMGKDRPLVADESVLPSTPVYTRREGG